MVAQVKNYRQKRSVFLQSAISNQQSKIPFCCPLIRNPKSKILNSLLLFLLLALLCCSRFALADIVHLKNGKTLHGEVIVENDDFVVIRVPYGEIKLKTADIELIERQTPLEYALDRGRQLLQQRNLTRAVQTLEQAVTANHESVEARRMLANAYELQGKAYRERHRFRESREAFEKLLKLDPGAELVPHGAVNNLKEIQKQQRNVEGMAIEARKLAAAEEYSRAIAAYEEILNHTPDAQQTVSPAMAQCHVKRALDYARNSQVMQAAADIEAALKLDPTQANSLEKFYVSCALPGILASLERGDGAAAQVDLKRVLNFAPTNPSALYVAGRLEEAVGRVPTAAAYYARGLRDRVANPTSEFTAKLRQRLEQELGIQGNKWRIETELSQFAEYTKSSDGPAEKLETENFSVYHFNAALARQTADAAEYHRARILTELNLKQSWKGKAVVFLHRTQAEYTAKTGQPEWTGGFSKVAFEHSRMGETQIHSWQTSPRLLKSVLPHEIAHLIINANLADINALPKCLHEGFAVLMEPKFRHDYFMNFLSIRLKSQDFIPLMELLAARDYPHDPEFYYAESYALLEYLIQQKSLSAVVGLLKERKAGMQTELLQISGARSIEDFETDWKKWILKSERKK
ncbi:MAG: tetratricopeptide repeat protein [Planctomycetota bacterium]